MQKEQYFRTALLDWYAANHRDLPWRNTTDPYKIWLSEIILQQTRVDQGLAYYHKFIEAYPKVQDLAAAKEQEVLKLWQGLGYYSRARNLLYTAKMIIKDYNGKFPNTYHEILKLKGVGPYTAAAIASFAFKEAKAVVDGNVYRVLSRFLGIREAIDSTNGKKDFQDAADTLLDPTSPDTYNQAIMEFGALLCTAKSPNCEACPLNHECYAHKHHLQEELPFKAKKLKQKNRYFHYLVLEHQNKIALEQRTGKGIWENLYQFPLVEEEQAEQYKKMKNIVPNNKANLISSSATIKHQLSHQQLHIQFHKYELENKLDLDAKIIWLTKNELHDYPVPQVIANYIKDNL